MGNPWGGDAEGRRNLRVKVTIRRLAVLSGGPEADRMAAMRRVATSHPTVVAHPAAARRQPPIRAGYEHFRLERQGALMSPETMEYYDGMVEPFLTYLDDQGVERFEHLRAAMGHSDFSILQRYVRMATERDLGPKKDWLELIAANPVMEWA
jgi:hypothetical protein